MDRMVIDRREMGTTATRRAVTCIVGLEHDGLVTIGGDFFNIF
jgi:hypothetical protein